MRVARRTIARRSTRSRRFSSNTFIQQQKTRAGASCSGSRRSCRRSSATSIPTWSRCGSAIQTAAGRRCRARSPRSCSRCSNEYQAALAQEQSLIARARPAEARRAGAEPQGHRVRRARSATSQSNRQIFDSLMQRTKETGISGELKTSNIRVVDAAETPRAPVDARTSRSNLLLGAVRRRRCSPSAWRSSSSTSTTGSRRRTRSRRTSGCRSSAWCRRSTRRRRTASRRCISSGVPPNFAEAFRAIRTNVLFSSAEEGARSRWSSRAPDPAKARRWWRATWRSALAQAGQRVLLIDADMRRPRVHDVFGIAQEPGLSNVLVGNAKASEAVRKTQRARAVGAAGRPHSAEPGGAARLAALQATSSTSLEASTSTGSIIDTPPVMAVTDAAIVAHIADRRACSSSAPR